MIPVNRVMKMDGYRFRKAGFTFIELMVTMVILGVIATSAMIPMVFMIRQLEYTEHDFAQKEGMNRAGSFLSREISNFGPAPGRIAFRTLRKEVLGGYREDLLLFWGASSSLYPGTSPGSVLYCLSPLPDGASKGLYRYTFPSVSPENIDLNRPDLRNVSKQLLIPGINEMSFSVWDGSGWADSFEGAYPEAVRFTLKRNNDDVLEKLVWIPR